MIIQLNNRSLLRLTGCDVQSFLQGQFSNDINALKENTVQLNAYCQHQGKIMALIWVMKKADKYFLSLPKELASEIIKKLTMFKMMADVIIENVSDEIMQLGVIDETIKNVFRLNNQQSIMLNEPYSRLDFELEKDNSKWEKACIDNELPEVWLKTVEKFVPQLLNLDINEVGVNFAKGCYPGQEVVARLHYLGKSKRRMRVFECNGEVQVGDKLIAENSISAKSSGVVVRCVKFSPKSFCLATIEIAHENDEIVLNNIQKTKLTKIHHD
jgi:folate-binding protein YgfZ